MGKFRGVKSHTAIFYAVVLVVLVFIVLVHGLFPDLPSRLNYGRYGAIECGAQNISDLFRAKCETSGGDAGHIYTTGLPVTILGAALYSLLPLNVFWVYSIVSILVVSLSLLGAYKLIRSLKVSRYVALSGATVFLLSPLMLSMDMFGGTYWGMLLIPFALYAVWWLLNLKATTKWKRIVLTLTVWLTLSIIMIFNDGYSFVMFAFSSGILLLTWAWNRWRKKEVWLAGAAYVLSTAIAYVLYKSVLPAAGSWTDSISLFRAMGLDLVTLIIPSGSFWWVQVLGIEGGVKGLWGDGSNSAYNYVGILLIALSIVGVYLARKKLFRLGIALIIIGLMSFILSLGPSLKVNSQKPPATEGVITYSSYLMPTSEAIVTLPTIYAYKLPGLKAMRATYRWHVVTLLVVIVFACLTIQYLVERKRFKLAYLLLLLLLVEFMPNPFRVVQNQTVVRQQLVSFHRDVIRPLQQKLAPGDRVAYFPNAVGDNDYLVNYLTPETNTWTYNLGGDKAIAYARPHMPPVISRLLGSDTSVDNISEASGQYMKVALAKGYVDKIVVPKFDLRWDSYGWPPNGSAALEKAKAATSAAQKNGLSVVKEDYFYVVSL